MVIRSSVDSFFFQQQNREKVSLVRFPSDRRLCAQKRGDLSGEFGCSLLYTHTLLIKVQTKRAFVFFQRKQRISPPRFVLYARILNNHLFFFFFVFFFFVFFFFFFREMIRETPHIRATKTVEKKMRGQSNPKKRKKKQKKKHSTKTDKFS